MNTYEKKYKEALETARKLNSGEGVAAPSGWTVCEVIFPELRESEDEKIRKEIISFVSNDGWKFTKLTKEEKESWIAWLEKQGDNNQNWKPSKGQINALEHFVRSIGESGYASPYDDNTNLLKSLINDLYKLESFPILSNSLNTGKKWTEEKSYLRPMSSMTEEEKEELRQEQIKDEQLFADCIKNHPEMRGLIIPHFAADWCDKNMFDYRGLIPKGLAIEAPEGMYKEEQQ